MSSSGDNLHKAKEKIYIVNMIETSLFKTHLEGKIQKENEIELIKEITFKDLINQYKPWRRTIC